VDWWVVVGYIALISAIVGILAHALSVPDFESVHACALADSVAYFLMHVNTVGSCSFSGFTVSSDSKSVGLIHTIVSTPHGIITRFLHEVVP
jgi:hypothetical protein